jgi:hypothetical protein
MRALLLALLFAASASSASAQDAVSGDEAATPSAAADEAPPEGVEPAAEAAPPPVEPAAVPPPPGEPAAVPPPPGELRRLVVIDAAAYGIDPIVARVATDIMRRTGAAMGYAVLSGEESLAAARRISMPYPPSPADLWRVGWGASAHRGAFARVWAEGGVYHIEIAVASLDGQGPWFARGTAGPDDLRDVVDRLLRSVLLPPDVWMPTPEVLASSGGGVAPVRTVAEPRRERPVREALGHPSGRDGRRWRRPLPEIRRFALALQTEASIGTSEGSFYNHYVGVRLDVRIVREFALGAYFAYTNLEGRDQRVSSFHTALMADYRIRPIRELDFTIPIRLMVGYLGFNGPVARLSAGVAYGLTENWEIGADLLVPTLYFLPDRVAFAFDFSVELGYRF